MQSCTLLLQAAVELGDGSHKLLLLLGLLRGQTLDRLFELGQVSCSLCLCICRSLQHVTEGRRLRVRHLVLAHIWCQHKQWRRPGC
jgi:hypothetical protein